MPSQSEHQFTVDSQGWLHESSALETMESMRKAVPHADPTSLEAEFMLLRAARQITTIRDSYWSKHGLNYSRVLLLRLLYTSTESRLTMGELATHMNIGSNSVTQLVDSLTERGYVIRTSTDKDKRVVFVSLTEQGLRLTKTLLPENVDRIMDTWSPLTNAERLTFVHLMAKVRLHLLAHPTLIGNDEPVSAVDSG